MLRRVAQVRQSFLECLTGPQFFFTEIGRVWYQKFRILTLIPTRYTWLSQKMHPIGVKSKKPDFWSKYKSIKSTPV